VTLRAVRLLHGPAGRADLLRFDLSPRAAGAGTRVFGRAGRVRRARLRDGHPPPPPPLLADVSRPGSCPATAFGQSRGAIKGDAIRSFAANAGGGARNHPAPVTCGLQDCRPQVFSLPASATLHPSLLPTAGPSPIHAPRDGGAARVALHA
jgi:hypothetical protein